MTTLASILSICTAMLFKPSFEAMMELVTGSPLMNLLFPPFL